MVVGGWGQLVGLRHERVRGQREVVSVAWAAYRIMPRPGGGIKVGEMLEGGVRPPDAPDAAIDPQLRADERRRMPLAWRGQRAGLGRAACRWRVPHGAVEAQDVHVVVGEDVIGAAKEDERVGRAREGCALPRLWRHARRLRAAPRARLRIKHVDHIRVGARVTAKDGERRAGRGARDARGGVRRIAGCGDRRPRQAVQVESVHVVVAARTRAGRAAAKDEERLALQMGAVAAAWSRWGAMDRRHLPLGLLLLNLEQAHRSRHRVGRVVVLGSGSMFFGRIRRLLTEWTECLVPRVGRQVGDLVAKCLEGQDARLRTPKVCAVGQG